MSALPVNRTLGDAKRGDLIGEQAKFDVASILETAKARGLTFPSLGTK